MCQTTIRRTSRYTMVTVTPMGLEPNIPAFYILSRLCHPIITLIFFMFHTIPFLHIKRPLKLIKDKRSNHQSASSYFKMFVSISAFHIVNIARLF